MRYQFLLPLLLVSCAQSTSQPKVSRAPLIMTYNVENFFDNVRDGSEYKYYGDEYIAREHYLTKAMNIETVIESAGCPSIVALMEVEGQRAVDMLHPACGYTTAVSAGGLTWDGVSPALLTNLPIIHMTNVWPMLSGRSFRPILKVVFEGDLTVYLSHWKSQLSPDEYLREASAAAIVQDITNTHVGGRIIVAGDLNEESGNALDILTDNGIQDCTVGTTYKYNGNWFRFDHIMSTECPVKARALKFPWLMIGDTPLRWDSSTGKGFSDHLPLIMQR